MPFRNAKALKIELLDYGSYFGMEKGAFVVRDKNGNTQKYPLFESEIGEVQFKSGNMVSTGARASIERTHTINSRESNQ